MHDSVGWVWKDGKLLQNNNFENCSLTPFGEKKKQMQIANCSKTKRKMFTCHHLEKKTNYKLQQKNHLHHLGKRKSKFQIAAKQNKKCFMSPFGKIKTKLQITAKKITIFTIQGKKAFCKLQQKTVQSHHWGKEKANCIRFVRCSKIYFQKLHLFFKMFLHFILFNICQCSAGLVSGRKKGWVPPSAFSIDSLIYFFSCKGSISISDNFILLIFIFSHFIRRNFSLDILSLLDWQSLMRNRGVRNKMNKQTPKWNLHWSSQEQPSSDHKDCL